MMALKMIITDDGDEYLGFDTTIDAAVSYAEDQGFERQGSSNRSEAVYLTMPGTGDRLRIAAHGGQRDRVVSTALFPQSTVIIDGEFQRVIPMRPIDALRTIQSAIAEYVGRRASC